MKKIIVFCLALCLCFTAIISSGCDAQLKPVETTSTSSTEDSGEKPTTSVEGTKTSSTQTTTTSSNKASVSASKSNSQSSSKSETSSTSLNGNLSQADKDYVAKAYNVIDWQLDNGGWGKNYDKTVAFKSYPSDYCWTVNGKFVGTIDNDATYNEMRMLAKAYELSKDVKFKTSFDKALTFLKNLQYSSGGFAQIYPHNKKYNDYVTLNDDAMAEVLFLLKDIAENKYPFSNITTSETRADCAKRIDKAVDYLIKAQIEVKGVKSAWCAQHDPTTYKPMKARAYELPSVSGKESVKIIQFLLTQTQNADAIKSANDAIAWLKSHRIDNKTYNKKNKPNFFTDAQGQYCWYRFYSLEDGTGFYCDRDGKVYTDIAKFYSATPERATGYDWAGNWLQRAGLNT